METVLAYPDLSFQRARKVARDGVRLQIGRRALNVAALVGAEGGALVAALLLAGWIRQIVVGEGAMIIGYGWAVIPGFLILSTLARLNPGWGLGIVEELRRTLMVLSLAFVLAVVGMWLTHTTLADAQAVASRLTTALAWGISLALVPWARAAIKAVLHRRGLWGVPVVVYGSGMAGARVVRQLQEEGGMGYTPVAVFSDDPEMEGGYLDTVPVVGGTHCVAPEASVAFLALPETESEHQTALLDGPLSCYRTVVIVPDLLDAPSLWVRPRDIGGVLGLEVTATLTQPLAQWAKRGLDLAAVLLTAPLWGPLTAVLALAVWLGDRARPFYGQTRVGRHGQTFCAWKLRTMVPDAEAVLQRALDADPALQLEWDTTFKLEHDPRITPVGRFLRRTSLDELPQLYNVLIGEMSLVGPRPLPRYHHDELPGRVRDLRERVRPGITGLWQVSGRSDSGTFGMERWDPYYVRNWSPWLDMVVLVRTLRVVTRGSGAY